MSERKAYTSNDGTTRQPHQGAEAQHGDPPTASDAPTLDVDMELFQGENQRNSDTATSTLAASGSSPAQHTSNTMSSSPGRPVQRLDSLKSHTGSSSIAGSSSALKKPLKYQPRFTGRRSKEERDRIAQEENERLRERLNSSGTEENFSRYKAKKHPYAESHRGRGNHWHRGRGGYMGESMTAGAISSGVATYGRSKKYGTRGGSSSASTSGTGSSRVKHEPSVKPDADADISMLGIPAKIEYDDSSDVSSDPDQGLDGPRKNVDFINLVSDEELDQPPSSGQAARTRSPTGVPVRIPRANHVNRTTGAKAEAIQPNAGPGETGSHAVRTGRVRNREVEVLRSERKWKGVYGEDDGHEGGVRIKEEPGEDNDHGLDMPADAPGHHLGRAKSRAEMDVSPPAPNNAQRASTPARSGKGKAKTADVKPVFQTEEDAQEWHRRQFNLQVLRQELGDIEKDHLPTQHTEKGDEAQEHDVSDRKADRVYLFQFPPVMPDLRNAQSEVKQEPSSETQAQQQSEADPATLPASSGDQEPIKVEDDDEQGTSKGQAHHPSLASGRAGKLRVHESGRATLSWGGTSFELAMGTNAHFLQDTVLTSITPAAERIFVDEGGEAMSFGQVRGKFVMTPDWSDIIK